MEFKAQGNAALAAGDMAQALDLYTQALDSSGSGSGNDNVQLRAALLSNRSILHGRAHNNGVEMTWS